MFDLRYKGKLCVPSHDALKDMTRHDVSHFTVASIIVEGHDYKDKMMAEGEVGRFITKGNLAVFVKLVPSYSRSTDEEVWLIKHVGKRRLKK
jgi:hypothetical protein